jgi:hypothetical protein
MKNHISINIMKKYSNLDIFQIINNVFKDSSALINEVNKLKPKLITIPQEERQLLGIIFQNNFC